MPVIDDNQPIEDNPPVDLDRVHEQAVNKLEAETAEANEEDESGTTNGNDNGEPTPNDDTDGASDDAGQSDNAPNGEDQKDDDTTTIPPEPTPEAKEPEVDKPKPEAVTPEPEPQLDTDITKNAHGKIAVKDSEGNTFYFNNMDEVPDDFEPESYKSWGVFTSNMAVKAQSDARAAEEQRVRKDAEAQQAEIDEVTNRWDSEIDTLTKGGILPADEKEREAEIGDTYAYIAKNLADGIVIDSFAAANKSMKYDRDQEAKAKADKAKADTTKKKGSMVMTGGGGTPSGTKKEPEPLPPGTSLDAVHARYSGLN